jgi:A/G-specific adenine glycosylase
MTEKDDFFACNLIAWYEKNKRDLPWRDTKDPYKIWLSEVILQQTRVAQGLPYFEKFILAFPTVLDLANAESDLVLRLWQGLGYYSRARNMHKTAKIIAEKGTFPDTFVELRKLPGIGDYTAAAIASFAFEEAVAVVDGNVFRVLSRYFGISDDIASPAGKKVFARVAAEQILNEKPSQYNQAIMEFGALHCKPAAPLCETCDLRPHCFAFAHKKQETLPQKSKKTAQRERFLHYFLVMHAGKILLKKRQNEGIWEGLYDLPCYESSRDTDVKDWLGKYFSGTDFLSEVEKIYETKHLLSHQKLHIQIFETNLSKPDKPEIWSAYDFYSLLEAETLPKPIFLANFLHEKFDLQVI